ncbi:hypothetical protein LCGC14_2879180 [marine sediment metagenome]|uniref:Homing endonuclease LAGLIDADG domain-containing protein n=1 Tax=marine sediment metagenome TaxID=412755 RepID=A0A0F9A8R6_9ZZZZ
MKRNEILAYLAGLADGEAYIGIKKTKPYKHLWGRVNPAYHERIQIRMVDEPAIRLFARTLGGWYYKEKPSAMNGRPLYCYQSSDLQAAHICALLLPYLRVKRRQAACALLLRKNKETAKRIKTSTVSSSRWGTPMTGQRGLHSPRTVAYRERLWVRCKALNRVGI